MTDLLDDLVLWLVLGILLAAVIQTFVSPTTLAAAMLIAGVSPGTVLIFLLTGPATNLAGLFVVRRKLGVATLAMYLIGVGGSALAFGLLAVSWLGLNIAAQSTATCQAMPWLVSSGSALILTLFAIKTLHKPLPACLNRTDEGAAL